MYNIGVPSFDPPVYALRPGERETRKHLIEGDILKSDLFIHRMGGTISTIRPTSG